MIKYNLKCNNDHEFESWFSDSKEFERLKTRKLLECIYCNSKKIKKSIMAPMISVSKNNNVNKFQINEKILQKQRNKLIKLRNYIEKEMKSKNVNIDLSNWDFLTGEKTHLYDIARLYLLASPSADELAPGGFIHSEYFVLIDKEGRIRSGIDRNKNIRGAYDGTNEIHMKDLVNDIKVLMAEYKKPIK